jgi:hypothetical protein
MTASPDGYTTSMDSLRRPSRVEVTPSLQDRVERLERALSDALRRLKVLETDGNGERG